MALCVVEEDGCVVGCLFQIWEIEIESLLLFFFFFFVPLMEGWSLISFILLCVFG